ncbi:uncharacterized protein LOC124897947 [Capsicum annuum]|uniref:uncharacterized protein LOC124897947 n=1 Tax=Capsicum annuum TaxID=4072 RepID=UPI001FB0B545|nr:uncharacterized protein LOC124897947 [Capsicum annuum]
MDLPKSKYTHWKANFIYGLPSQFAERVRKELTGSGSYNEISYENFTYGQLIVACTQQGLALCNELKLARKIKLDKLKERSQLGDFCEQFDMDKSDSTSQEKVEDLDLNVQTLIADSVLELLKEVFDEKLSEKIITIATRKSADSVPSTSKIADSTYTSRSTDNDYYMPYYLAEINRLLAISQLSDKGTSLNDLKIEVENLKKEIISLKQNQMICDHKIIKIEKDISHNDVSSKGKEKMSNIEKEDIL